VGSRGDAHLADVAGDQGAGRDAAGDWGVPGDVEGDVFQREELREGNTPFRQHSLSTSPFYLISQLAQLGLHLIAMIALNLDHAILDGASGAT